MRMVIGMQQVATMSFNLRKLRPKIWFPMTQIHRPLTKKRKPKVWRRQERQLSNPEYKKYLYEKYKVTFSMSELQFTFNGQQFPSAAPLIQKLHRHESTEINLTWYVLVIFLSLLCLVSYGVFSIDQYLQTFR
jgi:hypothetical protein